MTPPEGESSAGSELLRTLRLDSIKNKILALAVVATLIPALGTAILSYRQNRQAVTRNLNGELLSRGSQAAREIDLWVKERSYDVRVFTGSFEVSENLPRIARGGTAADVARARLTDYLVGVHGRFPDYADLVAMDDAARVVASSAGVAGDIQLEPEWQVRLGRGETVLGDPYWAAGRGHVEAVLAAPIETADARSIGVLAAILTLDGLEELLRRFAPGEGGRIDLVTEGGALIASSAGRDGPGLGDGLDPGVLDRSASSDGVAADFIDRDGTPVVGTLTAVPGVTWSVVTQIPEDEAYAELARIRNSSFALVFALLVLVGGVAYTLGVVIVRPLSRLAEAAGAVASGDLSVDLPVRGRGEVAYLTEVFNGMVAQLRRSHRELDERNQELERLSVTDLLTGLHNRRFLLDAFEKEIRRADRHERPFCVLMIDVDRFKQYNDTYGHLAGDDVLAAMGRVIRDAIRDEDVAARYGGEEFTVLLPECDLANSAVAAERIRTRLAQESFDGGAITISIGSAEFPTHGDSAAAVIAEADAALYEAKRDGRDCVRTASPKPEEETRSRKSERTEAARQRRGASKAATSRKKKGS